MRCASCSYDTADVRYRPENGLELCDLCNLDRETSWRFRLGLPYVENPEVRKLLKRIFGDRPILFNGSE